MPARGEADHTDGYKDLGLPKASMELSRRDAVGALAVLGAAGGAAAFNRWDRGGGGPLVGPPRAPDAERVRTILVAVADVVYPDEVEGVEEFVGTFLEGRLYRPDHASGLRRAVSDLDRRAESWYGDPIEELSVAERERLLREVGADVAGEDPKGSTAERIRYYVVNELLLALYASPTGGELVGLENPPGHSGGLTSYQRGPP